MLLWFACSQGVKDLSQFDFGLQDGSDNEKQSNDGPGTSRKPEKHGLGKAQAKISKGSRGNMLSPSQEVASSYGHLQISKKKRSVGKLLTYYAN